MSRGPLRWEMLTGCNVTDFWVQRTASSSSSSEASSSQFYTTLTASAATVVAIGSVSWYYHLYGREAFAMTPQEEGSD
jgi:ubiquinol-cytochrome c reductase cytochrome c1 subunit